MSPNEPIITVRDWRRRPPLRLRVTKKLDIHSCWIKCTRCPHMRAVAIAPYIIRWGPDGWQDMLRRAARCTKCGQRGLTATASAAYRRPPTAGVT
jgi:hypothetical protein